MTTRIRTAGSYVRPVETGDTSSAEQLFRRYFADVYRVVGRMLGPSAAKADIEDLTQQVFVAAHRNLSTYRGEGAATTWLYGIAHRTVLAFLRSRGRQKRLVQALAAEPRETSDSEGRLQQRDALRQAWTHLLRIKPKKRLTLILFEVEGLSGAEIAAALGVPEKTVWTRLHHARRELQRLMPARQKRGAW